MAGIYIHIPFCKQACHYCDFHFSTSLDLRHELLSCLIRELELQRDYLEAEPVSTIYVGGGTPSLLTDLEIRQLLNAVRSNFKIVDHPEITLEANPDDLSKQKLDGLVHAGVNRLSIGIQSFDEEILSFLNRAHNAVQAVQCVEDARSAGFNNISIDLIYAIPKQTTEKWTDNIRRALALHPEHVSAYSLTIEEKTAFGAWAKKGRLKLVPEEVAADEFEMMMDMLDSNGYEHYEISNFSLPGFESKHNSNYWRQTPYLGIGPSAHSYNGRSRQFNICNNSLYINALKKGTLSFESEILTPENKINEYIFTTLRTSWGCNLDYLRDQFHFDLNVVSRSYINDLQKNELATISDGILRLTKRGKLLADKIAADLFTPV